MLLYLCSFKEMGVKAHEEENNIFTSTMTDHPHLRKVVSDVANEVNKLGRDLEAIAESEEAILQAECECCGLKEDCTKDYISRIRNSYSGKWVCGLCSEAVKERLHHSPVAVEEAVNTHRSFVQEFNTTTRLNPKLSLTWTMRDIVRKKKMTRSPSCIPRIGS